VSVLKILFVAAGTGGHINPAIAIAKYCVEANSNTKVLFVGTKRGLENKLVPAAGFELVHIKMRGIKRKLTLENVVAVKELIMGYKRARQIIKNFKPDIVLGTGGYICGPVLSTSIKMGITSIIHESNAYPGVTTKLLAKKLDAVAVGFEETRSHLKGYPNVINTGTPVIINRKLLNIPKHTAKSMMGYNVNLPLILIYGGSQGASSINNAVIDMIVNHGSKIDFNVVFATGNNSYDNTIEKLNGHLKSNIRVVPYIYNMDELMAAADFAVTRAGAMTCNELTTHGVPAIMVPFPFAAENHQEFNARALEAAGAAFVILDKNLSGDILYQKIIEVIRNKSVLTKMSDRARKLKTDDADKNVYNIIMKLTSSR